MTSSANSSIDWPGLLKWSLQYVDRAGAEAAASPAASQPRCAEDVKFLQEAMAEFMSHQPNPNKMVEEALPILVNPEAAAHELLGAVSVIVEAADLEPELARYLDKFEGLLPQLQRLLTHPDVSVREKVAECLALMLPNNPEIQSLMHKQGLLAELIAEMRAKHAFALSADEDQNRYFTKLMSVLNALVKNVSAIESEFLTTHDGKAFVESLAATPCSRLQTKVQSMLAHLQLLAASCAPEA